MRVGIMQPYFVPYIGYWQLMNAVDVYVVLDDVNYINRGWINRNRILINGCPAYINLIMKGASQNKKINEIDIDLNEKSTSKLLKKIEFSYKKAPYFQSIYPIVRKIILNNQTKTVDYIMDSFKVINASLGINTSLIKSSSLLIDDNLKGQDKIIAICKELNATEYYNAIGGMSLYSREAFNQNDMDLFFLKTNDIVYKQFDNDFQPNLSIIDVLMFNSIDKAKKLLSEYTLI